MTRHFIAIISITAFIVLCMFLPFLPGRYDSLSPTLSFMTQLFSFAGLLLVPLGLLWLGYEFRKQKGESKKKTKHFFIATFLTIGFVTIIISLGALLNYNVSFGILFLAVCLSLLTRIYLKQLAKRNYDHLNFNPIPLYLIIIPLIVAVVRFTLLSKGVEFSRNYAIKKSEPLITAIEAYHAKNGSYPLSLQALHSDILPGIIGIKQYYYEPNGNGYNLYFKQFSDEMDVEEIVMYNKLDEHAFAAHLLDILEYSGQELTLRRGDRRRYRLSSPHWIYIKFD